MSHQDRPSLGIVLTIAAMFVLTGMDVLSKLLVDTYSVLQILWIRYVVFAGLVCALAWRAHGRLVPPSGVPVLQTARGLVLAGLNCVTIFAFGKLPLADVHAVLSAAPLFVVALSIPILGEPVGLRRWAAVVVGFVGVLVIIRPTGAGLANPWILLPVGSAVLFAVYQVLTRLASARDAPDATFAYTGLTGFVVMSLAGPFVWVWPDAFDWGMLAVAAALGILSHFLLIKGLEYAPASLVQPFNYTGLVWAVVLGLVVFGDFPDDATLIGSVIVIASGLYTFHRERMRQTEEA